MAYDSTKPADDEYLSAFPAEMREQLRAIVEDALVNALKVRGYSPGNLTGNIPLSNGVLNANLNADQLDGHDASYFSANGHAHAAATPSSNGFMANTDKAKLDGVATGAEVNQNAFSNVAVAGTTIQADNKTDTLTLEAGANIALTPDPTNDKVNIAVTGTVPNATQAGNANAVGNVSISNIVEQIIGAPQDLSNRLPKSGFFQQDAPTANYPCSGWTHLINCQHSNPDNNFALQIAGGFYDQNLFFRKTNGNGATGWKQFATMDGTVANANTVSGLPVSSGRNNVGNQIVRTDGNGYIQAGYINSSNGDEGNNSNPARVWGTNGSDSYLRSYLTSAINVNYANTAGTAANANKLIGMNWNWSGQGGQPIWLWGGSDGANMYVYNPSNFSVNYANSAGSVGGYSVAQLIANAGGIVAQSLSANGYVEFSNGLIIQWGRLVAGTNSFPIKFPDAGFRMITSWPAAFHANSSNTTLFSISTTGFILDDFYSGLGNKQPSDYIAIGY